MAATEIIGSVGVRVRPDTTGFRRELLAKLNAIKIEVDIPVAASLAKITAELAAWRAKEEQKEIDQKVSLSRKWLDRAKDDFAALGKSALTFVGSLAKVSVGLAAISSTIGVVGSLVSVLATASGVLVGVPAVLGAIAIGAGAVILGLDGIKKAFSANKSAVDALKASVSSTFTSELQPSVKAVNSILPQLTSGFETVAIALSGVANSATAAFKTSGISAFNALVGPTSTLISNVGAALGPVLVGLLNIARIGAEVFAPLTSGAAAAATKFREWTESAAGIEKINGWIQNGISALEQIGVVLSDVGRIFSSVFGAFNAAGIGLSSTFGAAIKSVADFFDTLEGQTVLTSIADAFKSLSDTISTFLGPALRAIAPLIPPLLTIITSMASQISAVLLPAIQTLSPILTGIIQFLADNISWIGPTVLTIVTAFTLWKVAAIALNAVLALNPFVLIAAAIVAGIAWIIVNWDKVKEAFKTGWEWIKGIFEKIWPILLAIVTGGIGNIVVFIVKNWDAIKAKAAEIWNAITGTIKDAWNKIKTAASDIWNGIKQFFVDTWNNIKDGAVKGWNAVIDFIKSIPGKIKSALGDLGNLLLEAGKAIIDGLFKGIKNTVGKVFDFVGNIAGKIADLKGPLPYDRKLLIPAGKAIMQGLYNGLVSGSDEVYGYVSGVGDQIAKSLDTSMSGVYSSAGISAQLANGTVTVEAGDGVYNQIVSAIEGWTFGIDSRGVAYKNKVGSTLNGLR